MARPQFQYCLERNDDIVLCEKEMMMTILLLHTYQSVLVLTLHGWVKSVQWACKKSGRLESAFTGWNREEERWVSGDWRSGGKSREIWPPLPTEKSIPLGLQNDQSTPSAHQPTIYPSLSISLVDPNMYKYKSTRERSSERDVEKSGCL